MQLCSYDMDGMVRLAVRRGQKVIIPALDPRAADNPLLTDLRRCIEAGASGRLVLEHWLATAPASCVRPLVKRQLCAPLPTPRQNVICLGWNYAEHAEESARANRRDLNLPDHPIVFTKAVGSVSGPYADIVVDPEVTAEFDWEVELGVIIGKSGRQISRAEALGHVFGYTVINDLSARDLQFRHKQFFIGKSLDGACPMGPVIVTADEVPDPQHLDLRCWVNGELKQESNTRCMIFDVAEIIQRLSHSMTLHAGDVIATGTPEGVGFARKPPEFLGSGDLVECEIEGIGRLANRILAPATAG